MQNLFQDNNGILASVPGGIPAAAAETLPDPRSAAPGQEYQVVTDAGGIGKIRLSFRLHTHKVGKYRHYFWSPYHAAPVEDDAPLGLVESTT